LNLFISGISDYADIDGESEYCSISSELSFFIHIC